MARLLLARDPVPRQKPPHRSIAEADAVALPDFLAQLHDRQVRLLLDLRTDEIGVRLDALRPAVAAHLRRRDASRGFDALRPTNRGRRTNVEPRRGPTARHPADDRLHHLLANIHRKRHDPPPEASVRLSSTDAPLDMGILAIILILYSIGMLGLRSSLLHIWRIGRDNF